MLGKFELAFGEVVPVDLDKFGSIGFGRIRIFFSCVGGFPFAVILLFFCVGGR